MRKKDLKNGEKHPGQKFIQTRFMILNREIDSFVSRFSDVFHGQVNTLPALKCIF